MGMIWTGVAVDDATASLVKDDPERLWALEEELDENDDPGLVDLDKAWHGIHWLLTGEVWNGTGPLAEVIFGGVEFGEDNGYGAPRLLSADSVALIDLELSALSDADIRARYDGTAMNAADLYPSGTWDEGESSEYVMSYLAELRAFYRHAAAKGLLVVQQIT